jgi:hypothetical protein
MVVFIPLENDIFVLYILSFLFFPASDYNLIQLIHLFLMLQFVVGHRFIELTCIPFKNRYFDYIRLNLLLYPYLTL